LEKKAIRAFGVAESFRDEDRGHSILGGVVERSDMIVDGFALGYTKIGGDDATERILKLYFGLERTDINLIIIAGAVVSLYNIVDIDRIGEETGIPTICVTFKESEGLEESIRHHFPKGWKKKLEMYKRLGGREKVTLKTGFSVYVRCHGLSTKDAKAALDKFTLQGAVPEPLRLARLIAKAVLNSDFKLPRKVR
jgi:hypothetical protein